MRHITKFLLIVVAILIIGLLFLLVTKNLYISNVGVG